MGTPTKKKISAPTRTITVDRHGKPDLYAGDRVHHPRFGDGTVIKVWGNTQPSGPRVKVDFDGRGHRELVLSLSPLVRYLRPKKLATDQVQVAFVYQGRQVETRVCARSQAEKLGQQLVRDYAPVFSGQYIVSELKPAPKVVPLHKPKPKVSVKTSAQYPKRPRPQIKVTHYFTIVT